MKETAGELGAEAPVVGPEACVILDGLDGLDLG